MKDSFGEPKPSGWRCVYFSLRHAASGLVGELQVTFDKIKAINGRSHRIYNLVRCMERGVEPAARTAQVAEETRRAAAKASKAPEDPLLAATKAGDAEAIARLLDGGAAVDQTRGDGETLLWTASFEGHVNAGRLLLDRGASADHGDDYGQTPLWVACFKGRVEMTRLLLAHGADASRATKKGTTPLGIAQKQGHASIVALLEKHLRDAKSPAAWYSEGIARKNEKKWPEAVAAFQNCVALDANHSEAWFELGCALELRDGKRSEALIEPYTRCIALDPKHADAHSHLGNVLQYVRKDYDAAKKHYQEAIELFPEYKSARWNLSIILENQKNDIPGAVKLMEEFVNLGGIPGWNDGKDRLAKLRAQVGDEKRWKLSTKPELLNDDGAKVAPGLDANYAHLYYCGRFLGRDAIPGSDGRCGKNNGPQCASCKRFQARSKSPAAWYSEGIARRDEKKWPEAVAAFQNCVALDANHSDAWYELGYAYNNQTGSYKATEASFEPYTRCIALDPKHATAHNNLGLLLKDVRKDYDGAEKLFRKAIELDPKHTSARWNLSLILEEQKNDIPGAVKLMEEYVNLGGNNSKGKDRLAKPRAKL